MKREYLIRTRTIFFLLFVLILAGLVAVSFLRESFDREKRKKCYRDLLVFNSRIARNLPDNAVVFLGDSLVQGLCVAAVTPYGVNLGIGRDTTGGVLQRLNKYRSLERVRAVIVAVGVNDLIHGHQDGIVERYELILQAIPGHVPIVLSAILPVDDQVTQKVRNKDVALLNGDIRAVCLKYDNCSICEITEKMVGFSGNLASEYHVGDGIHLSPQGYRIWINEMQRILADI